MELKIDETCTKPVSPKGINDLPNEVLEQIFEYLPISDIVLGAQFVSHRWKNIIQNTWFWKDRCYTLDELMEERKIARVLRNAPMLQALVINQKRLTDHVLWAFSGNCSHLSKLMFHSEQRLTFSFLKNLLNNCPLIEELHLPNNILSSSKKVQIIGQFQHLKHLVHNSTIIQGRKIYLSAIADGCPNLESIDLSCILDVNNDLEYFLRKKKTQLKTLHILCCNALNKCHINCLQSFTTLKELHLCHHLETESSIQALGNIKTITSLTLEFFHFTSVYNFLKVFQGRRMEQLEEFTISKSVDYSDDISNVIVRNCPLLKKLHLNDCMNLSDESLRNFPKLKHLQSVSLNGSGIKDGVKYLKQCPSLKHLSLIHCKKLTATSLCCLLGCKKLQVLKLDCYEISNLPLDRIPQSLSELRKLHVADFRGVNAGFLQELKRRMPCLSIIY